MTKKQRKIASDGYEAVILIADSMGAGDCKAINMIKAALRLERKCRPSIAYAKSLICWAFLQGYELNPPAAVVYRYAAGLQLATLVGGEFRVGARHLMDRHSWVAQYLTRIRAASEVRDD